MVAAAGRPIINQDYFKDDGCKAGPPCRFDSRSAPPPQLAGSRIQLMLLEGVGPGQQLRTRGNRSLVSSCTVHFADNQYAYGPIVLKRVVPVLDDDTPEALVERMFTQAVRWRKSHGWHSSRPFVSLCSV